MSGIWSSTGLMAARIKPIYKVKSKKIELSGTSKPAPFILRPFAGLFNPYSYGCSVFCNHSADCEAKEFVRRAKESWATEGKALLLPAEMEMIRAALLASGVADAGGINEGISGSDVNPMTNVPDELFRKYTETDSRPLTPTPTLASGPVTVLRDDNADFDTMCNPRERTTLILDLRTASQEQDIETLNWHAVILEPPPSPVRKNSQISKFYPPLPPTHHEEQSHRHQHHRQHQQSQQSDSLSQEALDDINESITKSDEIHENDENVNDGIVVKRRGKRLKKRKCRRGSTYGQQCEVRDPLEPLETQVSQVNDDSRKNSALVPIDNIAATKTPEEQSITSVQQQSTASSFISPELLKHFIRDLDNETVEQEFFLRRQTVMMEALRVKNELQSQNRPSSHQLSATQFPMAVNAPRIFSRQNARFELLDGASLATIKPLDYLGKHVFLTPGRKLMFARTFNKYYDDTMDDARYISSNDLIQALNEIMGKPLTDEQIIELEKLIGKIEVSLNFRTWCGVCAACERLLSPLPPRNLDTPTWIEIADFQALERRLRFIQIDEKLNYLLKQIRDR